MIPAPFAFRRVDSLEEAIVELADPDARVIAGGQSLVPMLKLRFARPSLLVDIQNAGLSGVAQEGEQIRIGAMTTYAALLSGDPRIELPAALVEAAAAVGDVQVRNLGTVGGSLAHADPAADLPAAVLALGGHVVVRGPEGERVVPAAELAAGPFLTTLAQQELLVELVVPARRPGEASAYVAVEDPASGYALAGAAAFAGPEGERIAVTGIGPVPFAVGSVDAVVASAGTGYRAHLAAVVARRALEAARTRARAEAA